MNQKQWQVEMTATSGLVTRAMAIGVANGLSGEASVLAAMISIVTTCTLEGLPLDTIIDEARKASVKTIKQLDSQMHRFT